MADTTAERALEHLANQEWRQALHGAIEEMAVRFPRQAQLFVAHLHGHSRMHLSAETGLSLKAVSDQLSAFRCHLRRVLAARYPDTFPAQLLLRRGYHNTSHLWASLATKTYTPYQLLSLPDKHRQVLERALQVARGGAHERNALLDAVCADFPDIQRQTVRRMIPTAINLLEHRHESGHENSAWADKRRLRAQMAQHYRRIHEINPAAWDALPERHRELIERYCFPETQPTQLELARQLGCASSSVSRRLDQLTRSFLRTSGTQIRRG